jgi:excisionase family DNA binding protein
LAKVIAMNTLFASPDEAARHPEQPSYYPQLGRSVSIAQAIQILGVSRRTVYYWIGQGRLQTVRTRGGSQRVLTESVRLARRRLAASPTVA